MLNIEGVIVDIERVDDLPVIYGLLEKMGVQDILDQAITPHGSWGGLSPGWVMTIWLMHILSEHNHLLEPVEEWVGRHSYTLEQLTGQRIRKLDFADDRLGICLKYLHEEEVWFAAEAQMGAHQIRVYSLPTARIRLDATVGTVGHDPSEHTIFKVGKAKNGLYETQFKIMLATLDPLGLPLVVNVEPGNRADDPLYTPAYLQMKEIVKQDGLLIIGDSKMSAVATRAGIVAGNDHYLVPLADQKDAPELLDELLKPWQGREKEASLLFFPDDLPADGSTPDPELAIGRGFEVSRPQTAVVDGKRIVWEERLLVIRAFAYVESTIERLHGRLDKAEAALLALTPARQRGKKQITDEATLLSEVKKIEKKYRVQGLFMISYNKEVEERHVRKYKERPAHIERKVRYQLSMNRNQEAITAAEFKAGWRIYATNAPLIKLSLNDAILAYRGQYVAENVFRRLGGKILSITPLHIQRDDHAQGLFHLLSIGARLLALGDYQAKRALAAEESSLTGIYKGNAKRGTATPTTERLLQAFGQIDLLVIPGRMGISTYLSQLTVVQERILDLLGLPRSLYTGLQTN
jgi:transposase